MLEKILKEIEQIEKIQFSSYTEPLIALRDVKEMVRRHMNDGWIPVEERLPEVPDGICDDECPEFNVTIDGANAATTLKYAPEGTWFDDLGYTYPVIAWQPLPEPYRPEKGSVQNETI